MAKYDERSFITELDENEIFVFGSNGRGAHHSVRLSGRPKGCKVKAMP